ncbi:TonB-dependent receptor [Phenylobacterium sp. LjRoot219]|uniref:TonB-dependent receptor domain-containing protein n=1 Tax=Phenylobacterium sp. LjRoot219 TaxID=3342283 RepID=UPI003ECDEA0A
MISCEDAAYYRCADVLSALAGGRPFGSLNISGTTYRFTNAAVYLQSTYKFTDTLSLIGGFRITSDKTTGVGEVVRASFPTPNNPTFACSNIAYFPNTPVVDPKVAEPSACRLERTEKSTKPTWVIDLDYKPNPDFLVYAKYARGYRQGSVNTSNVGFETWGPETVDSYEIGAKTSFNGTVRGNFNIAAFYNELKDQQLMAGAVAIPPFAGAAVIVNSGKSRIAGLEVDGAVTLLDDLTVSFGYAYLDTKLKS